MRTIPDAVLDQIGQHRPDLGPLITKLRSSADDDARQHEKALATAYLLGTSQLTPNETWYLSQVAFGGPWGGDWLVTAHAALLTGYEESYLRRLAGASQLRALKWGKTWYIRRDDLQTKAIWRTPIREQFRAAFDAFMASGEVEEAIERATRAGWGGPSEGMTLELFDDGSYRLLDKKSIGNMYQSRGVLIGIPQLTPDEWDDEQAFFDDAVDGLRERFEHIGDE